MAFIDSLKYADNAEEQQVEYDLKSIENLAKKIRSKAKGTELEEQFNLEYNELHTVIQDAIKSEKQISQGERTQIMLELGDVINLANDNDIAFDTKKKRSIFNFLSAFNEEDIKGVHGESLSLHEKDIDDLTSEEARGYLEYTHGLYQKKEEGNFAGFDEDSIDELEDQRDINVFQERLIGKILGEDNNGFNQEYIQGFNKSEGNYLIPIDEVEKKIFNKNIPLKEVNANEFANYFKYLNSQNLLTPENFRNIFSSDKIKEFQEIYESDLDTGNRGLRILLSESNIKKLIFDLPSIDISINKLDIAGLDNLEISEVNKDLLLQNYEELLPTITNINLVKDYIDIILKYGKAHSEGDNTLFGGTDVASIMSEIKISSIQPNLWYDRYILKNITLDIQDIKNLNVNKISDNPELIKVIIEKGLEESKILYSLLYSNNKLTPEINNIFSNHKYNFGDINQYINNDSISTETLEKSITGYLDNEKNNLETQADWNKIGEFLHKYGIHGNEDILLKLINEAENIPEFLLERITSIKLSHALLSRDNAVEYFKYIPKNILNNSEYYIKKIISKENVNKEDKINDIKEILNVLQFNNFADTITLIQNINNNLYSICSKKEIEYIYMSNDNFKMQFLILLQNNEAIEFYPGQKALVYEIIGATKDIIKKRNDSIKYLKEIGVNINKIPKNEKMAIFNKSIIEGLNKIIPGIDENEISNMIKLLAGGNAPDIDLVFKTLSIEANGDKVKIKKILDLLQRKSNADILSNIERNTQASKELNPIFDEKSFIDAYNKLKQNNPDISKDDAIKELSQNPITNAGKNGSEIIKSFELGININAAVNVMRKKGVTENGNTTEVTQAEIDAEKEKIIKEFDYTTFKNEYNLDNQIFEYLQKEEKEKAKEQKISKIEHINEKDTVFPTYEDYSLDKNSSVPILITKNGDKIFIDQEDKKMIEKNPDSIKNVVKMYEFFSKLNLLSIWDMRKDLALSIGQTNINLNDDGLDESELMSFGNAIIKKLNQINNTDLNSDNNTIKGLHEAFQKYANISSMLSGSKTYGLEGEDKFMYNLRDAKMFTSGYGLKISEFREAKSNNQKKETTW